MIAIAFRNVTLLVALQTALVGTLSPAFAVSKSDSATVVLPADTKVILVPTGTGGYSGLHNAGDPIDFTVKNAVIVNGWVAIPKGAPAHGVISDLTRPGIHMFSHRFEQPSLHFAFDWIQLTGGKVRLDNAPVEVKGRQIKHTSGILFKGTETAGVDPFLTAVEDGVEAKVATTVHVATSLRATALEQAEQTNDYITK